MEYIGDPVHIITTHNLSYHGIDVQVDFGGRLIFSETAEHAVPPVTIEPPTCHTFHTRVCILHF